MNLGGSIEPYFPYSKPQVTPIPPSTIHYPLSTHHPATLRSVTIDRSSVQTAVNLEISKTARRSGATGR
jgi:hypothetical protein